MRPQQPLGWEVLSVPEVAAGGKYGALQDSEVRCVDHPVASGEPEAQDVDRRAAGPVHEGAAEAGAVAAMVGRRPDAVEATFVGGSSVVVLVAAAFVEIADVAGVRCVAA